MFLIICSGIHNAISGKITTSITASTINKNKGNALLAIYPMSLFAIPCRTNKLNPTGGVIWAISTTITKKIPNQIISKPACLIIGSIIAIVKTTADIPSRNIPKMI